MGVGGKTNAGYGYFSGVWESVSPGQGAVVEETWPGCLLRREVVRGAVRLRVEGGRVPLVIDQADWQPIEHGLPAEQRDLLRKGKVLRAAVRVRQEPGRLRLVAVE